MLVAAYVVSALLEVVGIGLVVFDVLADRGRRIALTKKRYEVYGGSRRGSGSDTALLMRCDISAEAQKVMANLVLQNDRRLRALEANATREDELLQGVLLGGTAARSRSFGSARPSSIAVASIACRSFRAAAAPSPSRDESREDRRRRSSQIGRA